MPDPRPHILLVNDDGIHAEGIKVLYRGLADRARISVVAPETEQSARSQAITLFSPLTWNGYREGTAIQGVAVTGTPVDCVKMAIKVILKDDLPDLLISGINEGSNTGVNVLYSGTVGAAIEGAMHGIPSIALSVTGKGKVNYEPALQVAGLILDALQQGKLKDFPVLNINVPNVTDFGELKGFRYVHQAQTLWNDDFEKRISPQGREYYWLTGQKRPDNGESDTDEWSVKNRYISVTPLHIDMTDYQRLKALGELSIFG